MRHAQPGRDLHRLHAIPAARAAGAAAGGARGVGWLAHRRGPTMTRSDRGAGDRRAMPTYETYETGARAGDRWAKPTLREREPRACTGDCGGRTRGSSGRSGRCCSWPGGRRTWRCITSRPPSRGSTSWCGWRGAGRACMPSPSGAAAFAGERETGTLALLDVLPARRRAVWAGKVSFAIVTTYALGLVLLGAGPARRVPRVLAGVEYGRAGGVLELGALLLQGLAWGLFCSAVLPSALLAAVVGDPADGDEPLPRGRGRRRSAWGCWRGTWAWRWPCWPPRSSRSPGAVAAGSGGWGSSCVRPSS